MFSLETFHFLHLIFSIYILPQCKMITCYELLWECAHVPLPVCPGITDSLTSNKKLLLLPPDCSKATHNVNRGIIIWAVLKRLKVFSWFNLWWAVRRGHAVVPLHPAENYFENETTSVSGRLGESHYCTYFLSISHLALLIGPFCTCS